MSSTIERTTEPIRNTAAYKTLSETISDALDDSGSAKHAGFEEKEARRKRRQLRLEKAGRNSIGVRVKANPEYVLLLNVLILLSSVCHPQSWRGVGAAQGLATAGAVEPAEGDEPALPSVLGAQAAVRRERERVRFVSPGRDTDDRRLVRRERECTSAKAYEGDGPHLQHGEL